MVIERCLETSGLGIYPSHASERKNRIDQAIVLRSEITEDFFSLKSCALVII